jgi:Glucodextranase, domain B
LVPTLLKRLPAMRNHIALSTGLLLAITACDGGPGTLPEPPVLAITSPQRSLVQNGAGAITVTGTVTANAEGDAIDKVSVNGVQANVAPDGSFTAQIQVQPGATLIHTIARDVDGGEARDTRAVHAGNLKPNGTIVERAVTAAISKDAFAKIAGAAGTMVKGMDIKGMIGPMNPMIRYDDPASLGEEDCLFARGTIADVKFTDVKIALVPKVGGITFSLQISKLDVPGSVRWGAACVKGTNDFRVTADKITVGGTLIVTPDGMNGFKTDLQSPVVNVQNLDVSVSSVPDWMTGVLSDGVQAAINTFAPMAMKPVMNMALGALGGPKTLDVLGHKMDMQVQPADIFFDKDGGLVVMDMKMVLQGTQGAKGFIYTENGLPTLDPGNGFQIGLADDLANQMMGQAGALGLLNLAMPASGGTFDNAEISMTLPPMISADPADGKMKVILGDMVSTFTFQGTPVGKAAISATIDLKIEPANNGYGVAVQLGKPEIHVTVMNDIANVTRMEDADLARAVEVCLTAQIASISKLLAGIPLPQVAGLQMRNLSVGADDGYVMVKGTLE